jgi:CheY-like chemotaxis protein/DNA-binding transcriptional ArsR family regulator
MVQARILVVDDDQELRTNIAEVLSGAGFETKLAASGEDALARMVEGEFDLVLLDLLMPGMGGMAALEQLKQRFSQSRVVVMTAFATVENAVEAMRKGADDYVTKPFRINDLLATVRRILEQARFAECRFLLDMDSTFNCLANVLRREILKLVGRKKMRFMDIARSLEVDDHTKINFHLKTLRDAGFICQDERKCYELTAEGRRIIDCMDHLVKNLTSG